MVGRYKNRGNIFESIMKIVLKVCTNLQDNFYYDMSIYLD
jgi:hypothetical protein